jgi:5-(carboxyamino)imidazole ribonucleotide synthase
VIVPPATLGILGGGQLGRYFVLAARTMGYRTIVLEPDPGSPAGAVSDVHLVAAYDDVDALDRMARECAVVTTEFENPPAAALTRLAAGTTVHPSPHAIAVTQDRRREKRFLAAAGIPVAPFEVIEDDEDVRRATGGVFPAILKTARMGYDGKGQIVVRAPDELAGAWAALGRVPAVLEERLALRGELSVILARNLLAPGESLVAYPLCANIHRNGILDVTVVPGPYAIEAYTIAERIADALDYVGVLAVELFLTDDGIVVNEVAPRPHNSGHWTLDHSATSQFEQQVRAICGLALGDTSLTVEAAAMANLLGEEWADGEPRWEHALDHPAVKLHLYGKAEPRPGRKMGHITVAGATPATAEALARRQRTALRAPSP